MRNQYRSYSRSVGLLALATLLTFGCSSGQQAAPQEGGGGGGRGGGRGGNRQAIQIQSTTTQRITIERQVDLSGTLVSLEQVRVSPEVPGMVEEVLFELGREVRAGQELIRLNDQELQLAMSRAESALRQTEAQLGIPPGSEIVPPDEQIAGVRTSMANRDDARAQLARAEELVSRGLLPQAELDTTSTRVKVTEANVQASLENVRALKASLQDRRASYDLARKKLDDAVVRAPISGSISERTVQRGEFVRENTVIATIVQVNPLKLVTAVQEKYSDLIRPGLPVRFSVESLPGRISEGRVAYVSPSVDQATRTFQIEILVQNADRSLKPGFFAKGAVYTQTDADVVAVPETAVTTLAGVSSVFVIENGVVRQQNIRIGARQGSLLEILEGLNGDELLAGSNLNELVSGIEVTTGNDAGGGESNSGTPAQRGQRGERGQRAGGGGSQ